MAKAVSVSSRAVQRLWEAHRLQPHRIRTFKRSDDPDFAAKVEDVVGLYMDPPKHAVAVSIDEKIPVEENLSGRSALQKRRCLEPSSSSNNPGRGLAAPRRPFE
jgi:hypothetical protein